MHNNVTYSKVKIQTRNAHIGPPVTGTAGCPSSSTIGWTGFGSSPGLLPSGAGAASGTGSVTIEGPVTGIGAGVGVGTVAGSDGGADSAPGAGNAVPRGFASESDSGPAGWVGAGMSGTDGCGVAGGVYKVKRGVPTGFFGDTVGFGVGGGGAAVVLGSSLTSDEFTSLQACTGDCAEL